MSKDSFVSSTVKVILNGDVAKIKQTITNSGRGGSSIRLYDELEQNPFVPSCFEELMKIHTVLNSSELLSFRKEEKCFGLEYIAAIANLIARGFDNKGHKEDVVALDLDNTLARSNECDDNLARIEKDFPGESLELLEKRYNKKFHDKPLLFDRAVEFFKELKKSGKKVAIVSNGSSENPFLKIFLSKLESDYKPDSVQCSPGYELSRFINSNNPIPENLKGKMNWFLQKMGCQDTLGKQDNIKLKLICLVFTKANIGLPLLAFEEMKVDLSVANKFLYAGDSKGDLLMGGYLEPLLGQGSKSSGCYVKFYGTEKEARNLEVGKSLIEKRCKDFRFKVVDNMEALRNEAMDFFADKSKETSKDEEVVVSALSSCAINSVTGPADCSADSSLSPEQEGGTTGENVKSISASELDVDNKLQKDKTL